MVTGRFSYDTALAWHFSTQYQLCRRWCFRQSMSYYTREELPLPVQRRGTDGINLSTSG